MLMHEITMSQLLPLFQLSYIQEPMMQLNYTPCVGDHRTAMTALLWPSSFVTSSRGHLLQPPAFPRE